MRGGGLYYPRVIALRLNAELQRHLRVALEQHRRRLRADHVPLPEGWETLVACLAGHDTYDVVSDHPLPVPTLLLTYEDVATALQVSERTVERLTADGRLAAVKVNGATRIRRADLDAYVAALPRVDGRAS